MKNKIFTIDIIILFLLIFSSICFGIKYGNYVNSSYNYKIIIPETWKKVELTLTSKHFMYASFDKSTEIKVRAFKSSEEDYEETIHKNKWDLRKIDPRLNKIIETEKIKIKKNITGKLIIFEYRTNNNYFLQRTLITNNNDITYIVECKSPQNQFYKYEDVFNTALASFQYIESGASSSEKVETKDQAGKDETEDDLSSDEDI